MDQGATTDPAAHAGAVGAPAASPATPAQGRTRRRRSLAVDLTILGLVGVLLLAAVGAGVGALYREFYSPTAFVERYLELLGEGRAADALAVPGVAVDSSTLADAGLPETASDALLRRDALTTLGEVTVLGEERDGDVTHVRASYSVGGRSATTVFEVESAGWIGVAPTWRFAESPLATLTLVVRGSQTFAVNGFDLDKRQVSPMGADAEPLEPVSLLVFSPGLYRVSVENPLASTDGVDVLADAPLTDVPLDLQAEPTEEFIAAVKDEVDAFLDTCAEQQVLNPTGCPFGFTVFNRILAPPVWTIAAYPAVDLVPSAADWAMVPTDAVAHIEVEIQSLFDGSVTSVSEDVPFRIDARIVVQPDGTASIRVGSGGS